ncbi:GH1 family beta-glucosidase [Tunicatimonas pelagia]|uniref:GH1 family beta-glucosidase n=1 Tax=Tunicatimonas pelagia TaxID=931531 RepID=UPI002665A926|nr:GH1 family beta-glucosidase [Tunicatimonas pelagia]WKN42633.1 GH1 family beta-glucosidase [Tunicatimonas pelagia]
MTEFSAGEYDPDFKWGVSTAAYQTEGSIQEDGKGLSIWDEFSNRPGKIYNNHNANQACDFYHRYPEDLSIIQQLGIPNFRFSIAWSRVLPQGVGAPNRAGLDFYDRLVDSCLEQNIEPWITLYHWDLPVALHRRGGWTNRDILNWFTEYVELVVNHFKDRVTQWMVLNEPMVFTGAGYFLGIHAPGKRGMKNFSSAVHHATLCQAEGGRIIRDLHSSAHIGTTFSCSLVEPASANERDVRAAQRVDALLNRLFIEPALGRGYPINQLPALARLEKHMRPGDEQRLKFDFDFIGLQCYTREVIRYSWSMPYIFARQISPQKRAVPTTLMGWEVYADSMYHILTNFYRRYRLKKIIITENGAAFADSVKEGKIDDYERERYLSSHIHACLRAKREGVPLSGYFVWTLTDNFEWAEGYRPTFGLVHVNFQTQERIIKRSGQWYANLVQQYLSQSQK